VARFFQSLFGSQKTTTPPASALRVNTSLQGVPLTLFLGGQTRIGCNLIDYYGFNSQSVASAGGGGGKGGIFSTPGGTETVYYATLILAACEGPVAAFEQMWVNGTAYAVEAAPLTGQSTVPSNYEWFFGDYAQTTWSYTESADPSHAEGYRGIAYMGAANLYLGTDPSLPNFTFELLSNNNTAIPGQPDGDVTIAFTQFLTNGYNGVGFPADRLGSLTDWQSYTLALGLVVSPALATAVQASSYASDMCTFTNAVACWQYGFLTVEPYGDSAVTLGSVTSITETHIVPNVSYPSILVGNAGSFVADEGVTYLAGGSLTPVTSYNGALAVGTYYEQGGTYYFSQSDIGQTVLIEYTWAATSSYVPNTNSLYDFTIDDCLKNQGTIGTGTANPDSPFLTIRISRDQVLNNIKLEYLDRNNNYNPVDIEQKDEASIIAFGRERPSDIKQAHFFCLASAAQQSAVLQLLRQNIIRTFQWTVGRHFMLILELMAIATITDSAQGLNRQGVRIIEIQENEDFTITITGEEFLGTVSAPEYGTQAGSGFAINAEIVPNLVNTPIVFEPPATMLGSTPVGSNPEVWIAISGGPSGTFDPNFGGCFVWLSLDGSNYQNIGKQTGAARMGVLTTGLPTYLGTNPDNVDTLTVNLSESNGSLASITPTGAGLAANLCIIDDELLTYTTATLVSGNTYALTGLNRGLYGSVIQSHAVNAPFARLDTSIFTYDLPAQYLNQTLYLKFQAYNGYGLGLQTLAECVAYTFSPAALAYAHPLAQALEVASVDLGQVNSAITAVDDFGGGVGLLTTTTTQPYILIDIDLSVYFTISTGSLIFRSVASGAAANQYTTIPQNTNANQQKFTFATWFKYGGTSETANLFLAQQGSSANQVAIQFVGGASFAVNAASTALGTYMSLTTSSLVSDELWHHLCVAIDTTQATAANRVKLYLDGSSETLSGTSPPQNTNMALGAGVNQGMGASTGGTITTGGGYRIHTFTGSGTFTASAVSVINYLVVAGGGSGGGHYAAGGGGGGGVLAGSTSVTAGSYAITVGLGGAGLGVGSSGPLLGNSGGNSEIAFPSPLTAIGGGGGGGLATNGATGGSGGGGGTGGSGGSGTGGQGNAGAAGSTNAGGGGGAGGGGNTGSGHIGGAGGSGISSSITGTSVIYGGGGGGAGDLSAGGAGGAGGSGGGGAGGNNGPAVSGTPNTGGGGGGASLYGSGGGGSGIVVIAYLYSTGGGTNSFGFGFDGKMEDTYYIDGQALPASDFAGGSPLAPITFLGAYTGVADGFYAYNNSSSVTALGFDLSGENNNVTPVNMTVSGNSSSDYP
jgi:hypothetical protein